MNWLTPKMILWISVFTGGYFSAKYLLNTTSLKLFPTEIMRYVDRGILVVLLVLLFLANYRLSIEKDKKRKAMLILSIVMLCASAYFNIDKFFTNEF